MSNSGKLANQVDPVLLAQGGVSATSDSWILDECQAWADLVGPVVAQLEAPWLVAFRAP